MPKRKITVNGKPYLPDKRWQETALAKMSLEMNCDWGGEQCVQHEQ